MKLLKCTTCREYVNHAKEHIRIHERKNHAYGSAQYEPHHHIPLTKEQKDSIVAKGETRLGLNYFFGYDSNAVSAKAE